MEKREEEGKGNDEMGKDGIGGEEWFIIYILIFLLSYLFFPSFLLFPGRLCRLRRRWVGSSLGRTERERGTGREG